MNKDEMLENVYKHYCVKGVLVMPNAALSIITKEGVKGKHKKKFFEQFNNQFSEHNDVDMGTQKENTIFSTYDAPDFFKEKGVLFVKIVNVKADVHLLDGYDPERVLKDLELSVDVQFLTENK